MGEIPIILISSQMKTIILPVHAIGFGPQGLIAAFHMIESTTMSPREDGAMFFTWLWPFQSQVQTDPGADANSYSNATRNSDYHDLGVMVSTSAGNLVDLVKGAAAAGSGLGMDQPVAPPLRPLLQRQDPSVTSLARFRLRSCGELRLGMVRPASPSLQQQPTP